MVRESKLNMPDIDTVNSLGQTVSMIRSLRDVHSGGQIPASFLFAETQVGQEIGCEEPKATADVRDSDG